MARFLRIDSLALGAVATLSVAAAPANAGRALSAPAVVAHHTVQTRYVEAGGVRLAYRRFGTPAGVPLLLFQHFAGSMDNWDPKVTDGLARTREIILFDNAGVSASAGTVPTNIEGMARQAIALAVALQLEKVDLLGFSMGSMVAQDVAIERPALVRKLVLVGSAPRGGVAMATLTPEFQAALARKRAVPDELLLETLFTPSTTGQASGRRFLDRIRARTVDRDPDVAANVPTAQAQAIAGWGAPRADNYAYLKAITQPVLLIDGSDDKVFYTVNAFNLQQHLANATLTIYPDSGHGPQDRFPDRFVRDVTYFLDVDQN